MSSETTEQAEMPETPKSSAKRWYVVQAASGKEKRAVKLLNEAIINAGMESFFGQILVPTEEVVEMRAGVKRKSERKHYPGYVFLEMDMNDATSTLVQRVQHISGFIGTTSSGKREKQAVPLSRQEVAKLLASQSSEEGAVKAKPRTMFNVGEVVRVLEGPFAEFTAVVEQIDYDKSVLKVAVSIFGRSTPVDLEFSQVEKEKI